MQIRFYGIYDGVAKEFVRQMTSKDDDTAQRSVKYVVREQGFDKIAGKDYVLQYLYTWDSETGLVLDNSVHAVCSFGQALDEYEAELISEKIKAKVIDTQGQEG